MLRRKNARRHASKRPVDAMFRNNLLNRFRTWPKPTASPHLTLAASLVLLAKDSLCNRLTVLDIVHCLLSRRGWTIGHNDDHGL